LFRSGSVVRQNVAQFFTFEQFGDDVRRVLVSADVVDRQDVRMVESRSRARFLLEAFEPVGVLGEISGQILIATSRSSRVSHAR